MYKRVKRQRIVIATMEPAYVTLTSSNVHDMIKEVFLDPKLSFQLTDRGNTRGILWGRVEAELSLKVILQECAIQQYKLHVMAGDVTSTSNLKSNSFSLTKRTFINSNNLCPVEALVPMLVSGCQVNTDVCGFFENATSAGVRELCSVVLAFRNPTKANLRNTKNSFRDYMLQNKFFPVFDSDTSVSSRESDVSQYYTLPADIPYFNISILLETLALQSASLNTVIGLSCLQTGVCSSCGCQVIANRHDMVTDVLPWLQILPDDIKILRLGIIIDSVRQRTETTFCTFCCQQGCAMTYYLSPKKFLIFQGDNVGERVFWDREITFGDLTYKLIGITKFSSNHFLGDVLDHNTNQWLHFNSVPERRKDRKTHFTLHSVNQKKRKNNEGVHKKVNCVHYVRVP